MTDQEKLQLLLPFAQIGGLVLTGVSFDIKDTLKYNQHCFSDEKMSAAKQLVRELVDESSLVFSVQGLKGAKVV